MKKPWIIGVIAFSVLAILMIPIPKTAEDGGTRVYQALSYQVVDWKRPTDDGVYEVTDIYWFPHNFKDLDTHWLEKEPTLSHSFTAKVIELGQNTVLVEPVEGEPERRSSDLISFGTAELPVLALKADDYVKITYVGGIMESYPAQIHATDWEIAKDLRHVTYQEMFVDPRRAEPNTYQFHDVTITAIYADCFIARSVIPMPYVVKFNGTLSEQWCVGDRVAVTYRNAWHDPETSQVEADLLTIEESTFVPQEGVCYKPVVYLYPREETQVAVSLQLQGKLTCTYPAYEDGWTVTAKPDGTLTDAAGKQYNYLYWEGETAAQWDTSEGFCVPGKDTAAFLENALEKLGLNRREANEFIVYWLPQMERNAYNVIHFQTAAYENAAGLQVEPAPDTLIRVFMTWKGVDSFEALPAQTLTAPDRNGFTVVEWGGTELS